MIVRSLLITPLCLLILLSGYSQDTTHKKWRFDIGFESFAAQHFYKYYRKVSQPALIRDLRKATTSLPVGFDTITDNPYMHCAMYMAVKTTTTLHNKLTLKA